MEKIFEKVIIPPKLTLGIITVYWLALINGNINNDTPIEQTKKYYTDHQRYLASEDDLNNPQILCISCGGSGEIEKSNFDQTERKQRSAAFQMWKSIYNDPENGISKWITDPDSHISEKVLKFVSFVDAFESHGKESVEVKGQKEPFFTNIIGGILLTTQDHKLQLKVTINALNYLLTFGQSPYYTLCQEMQSFYRYELDLYEKHKDKINKIKNQIQFGITEGGKRYGYIQSDYYGTLGIIYSEGAEIAITFNPNMKGVKKFTIASNTGKVDSLIPILNQYEKGWGGPENGRLIGSPMDGSALNMEVVVKLVQQHL